MSESATLIAPLGELRPDGIWQAVRSDYPEDTEKRAALFLDRDGVINIDSNYVFRVDDLQIIDGAAEMIAAANRRDIPVVIVTNQSGIGRGYFDWAAFTQFQAALEKALFERTGASIDAAFACAYHRDGVPPYNVDNHPGRKPNPGMILAGAERLSLELEASWLVGDRWGDIEAAIRAGLAGGVLIGDNPPKTCPDTFRLFTVASTADAASYLPILEG